MSVATPRSLAGAVFPARPGDPGAGPPRRPAGPRRMFPDRPPAGHGLRPVVGLVDLTLPTDATDATDATENDARTVRWLADQVEHGGGAGCDVRLLSDVTDRPALAQALADELERDVLVCPPGAAIRYLLGFGPDGDEAEAVPVDHATRLPVDWHVVRPRRWSCDLPGWHELADGIICLRTGPVTVALPGGLSLATRGDFVRRRAEAARLRAGHPGLTTLSVPVRAGGFLVGDYSGATAVRDGRELAAALPELPLYGGDLRVWLAWPRSPVEQDRLLGNLADLADTTGAVVWVAPPGGRSEVVEPHGDLVALDAWGTPDAWCAVPPGGLARPARFTSDADGRLVPAGAVVVSSWPGVPLVSVSGPRERRMLGRYGDVRPSPGLFAVDLAVLADGRGAVRHEDGVVLAVGPEALRQLLHQQGWRGEDLHLLSAVAVDHGESLRHWAGAMATALGCEVWTAEAGTTLTVDAGLRLLHPDGRPARWQLADPADQIQAAPRWVSVDGRLIPAAGHASARPAATAPPAATLTALPVTVPTAPPAATLTAPPVTASTGPVASLVGEPLPGPVAERAGDAPIEPVRGLAPEPLADLASERSAPDPLAELAPESLAALASEPSAPHPLPDPEPLVGMASGPIPRPRLMAAPAKRQPHGLYWLPEDLEVNADAIEVHIDSPWPAERCLREGVPSPELFLVGRLDQLDPTGGHPGGCVLRVRVAAGGAIALSAGALHGTANDALPVSPRNRMVIPAGWLDQARVVGHSTVDGDRRVDTVADAPLRLRATGAAHGADGIPNDVQFWPHRRPRTTSRVYAVLPAAGRDVGSGWIELFEHRPSPVAGERLVALRIAQGQAIDVAASAARLKKLAGLRTRLGELRASGIRLVLPQRSYDRVGVAEVYVADGGSWRREPGEAEPTLGQLIAPPAT